LSGGGTSEGDMEKKRRQKKRRMRKRYKELKKKKSVKKKKQDQRARRPNCSSGTRSGKGSDKAKSVLQEAERMRE